MVWLLNLKIIFTAAQNTMPEKKEYWKMWLLFNEDFSSKN